MAKLQQMIVMNKFSSTRVPYHDKLHHKFSLFTWLKYKLVIVLLQKVVFMK